MYFEGGVSSVYLWDLDEDSGAGSRKEMSFAGVVVMKKGTMLHKPAARSRSS
jgi:capping protein beta